MFLETFVTNKPQPKVRRSVASSLKDAFKELFEALNMDTVLVEGKLEVTTKDFIKDFITMCDEVKSDRDIVITWHVDPILAKTLFSLFSEVVFGSDCDDDSLDTDSEHCDSDCLDQSTDSDP